MRSRNQSNVFVKLNRSRLLVVHPLGGLGRNRHEFAGLFLHVSLQAGNAVGENCKLFTEKSLEPGKHGGAWSAIACDVTNERTHGNISAL